MFAKKRLQISVSVLLHCQYITLRLKLVFVEFEFCVFSMFFKHFLLWCTKRQVINGCSLSTKLVPNLVVRLSLSLSLNGTESRPFTVPYFPVR